MTSWGNLQPLSTEFFSLLRYGLFLVLFLHRPFVGSIIGGSPVSLLLSFLGKEKRDPAYLRFSKELMETVMIRRWPLFLFGIVPLLLVWFAYARILFDPTPLSWHLWSAILVILFAGFSLLHRYRSHGHRATDPRPLPIGIGAAGLLGVARGGGGRGRVGGPGGSCVMAVRSSRFPRPWSCRCSFCSTWSPFPRSPSPQRCSRLRPPSFCYRWRSA